MKRQLQNCLHSEQGYRVGKQLAAIAKANVLLVDDFAISTIAPRDRVDLLELLDDRFGTRAILIASQLPIENRHDYT